MVLDGLTSNTVYTIEDRAHDADRDGNPGTYYLGDQVRVRLTFTEAVDVDTSGGRPRLKIRMNPSYGDKWVEYEGGRAPPCLPSSTPVEWPNESPLVHAGLDHNPAHRVDTDKSAVRKPAGSDTIADYTLGTTQSGQREDLPVRG